MVALLKTTQIQEPSSGTVNLTLGTTGGVTFGAAATTNTITSASATALTIQSAGTTAMTIDTSQNVGIGTTSPAYKLAVTGTVGSGSTGTNGYYAFKRSSDGVEQAAISVDGTSLIYNNGTGGHIWQQAGTERMRIDSSGNLLVGTTSASVATTGHVEGGSGYADRAGQSGSWGAHLHNLYWNGSAFQLWVDATNLGTINVTSDYRIKQNVETQTVSALDRIEKIRPITYRITDYKNLYKADGIDREGFLAHELAEIIPSAVEGEKDDENQIQSLKLDALCSVLVKAIQELSAKVDAQAVEIAALKSKVGA